MYYLQLLVTLCSCLTAYGCPYQLRCVQPNTVANFSMKRLSGVWYYGAYILMNKHEAKVYENSNCGYLYMDDGENGQNRWIVDFSLGGNKKSDMGGTFYFPDPSVGLMKAKYLARCFTYDSSMVGTDYTSWLAMYACKEESPTSTSAWALLFVRNMTELDEIISRKEVQDVYKAVTSIELKDFRRPPFVNCTPSEFFQQYLEPDCDQETK